MMASNCAKMRAPVPTHGKQRFVQLLFEILKGRLFVDQLVRLECPIES